jgi:hypothetical protein
LTPNPSNKKSAGSTNKETTAMHCYQYIAAVSAVANTVESCCGAGQKLPYSVLADWMEENGIEAEDVLLVGGSEVRAIVESLLRQDQPHLPHAA